MTLNQDSTPIYALQPSGPFSETAYKKLLHAFRTSENISLVSIPGFITGSTRLSNGMIVPVLAPDSRGIAHWDIETW